MFSTALFQVSIGSRDSMCVHNHELVVVFCSGDCLINDFQHIAPNHVALTKYPDARTVSIENVSVIGQLLELNLGHLHESLDFVLGSVIILDAKGIDSYSLYAALVTNFHDLRFLG